ncbi:LysE family translocator [Hoeflea sp. G2-23]|uniref:LysE family translocator n=1 Tax=Hoeflea algicola TaxID=2983763 RepID=A0ABT3Z3D3_9HYPH|nr:LysE family translocator [Hoeflea algicola]MCY0146276.1 LysE family translocator [Hoeflea algicola]
MQWTIVFVSVFAIFIPALMLPGPDFIAVVRSAMGRGTRAGLLTTLGVTFGLGFYAGLSLLGLSAILVQYQWLAWAVRICGGFYLGYLGIRLLLTKPAAIELDGEMETRLGNPLLFGFLVTLTTPKAIVLFTSVFATAVTDAMPLWVMGAMIALVMTSAAVWYSVVTLFMSSRPVIVRFQNARHWVERAAGVCFIAIGGKILADSRNPLTP